MRHRVALSPLLLVIACAASLPRVDLPESGVEPTAKSVRPEPRTDGRSDGPAPRRILVQFNTGKSGLALEGWCREGVWTTLEGRAALPFVSRESWSRLGQRPPRRIAGIKDAVYQGAFARLRPTTDGFVDFVLEISSARVGPDAESFAWQDATIRLPLAHQEGFRFEGRVSAGYIGEVAGWGELHVTLADSGEATVTADAVRFRAGMIRGAVAGGHAARAETYRVSYVRRKPVERDHDGIVQALFRIERRRVAAGFRYSAEKGAKKGSWVVYGDDSIFVIDE